MQTSLLITITIQEDDWGKEIPTLIAPEDRSHLTKDDLDAIIKRAWYLAYEAFQEHQKEVQTSN